MKQERTPRPDRDSETRRDWQVIALLACLVALFMWRIVLMGKVMMPLDMVYTVEPWRSESFSPLKTPPQWNPLITDAVWQFYPMGAYVEEARHEGLPFWDPTVLCGMPGLARGELFSNPAFNFFATFLSAGRALSWAAVAHLLIAAVFMFLLLREIGARRFGSVVASLAFTFNGYLVGWLSMPNVTGSMVWLPLVAWGIERALKRSDWRWALVGALGFGMQILSGSILWPFYGGMTLGLVAMYRSAIDWWRERKVIAGIRPLLYTGLALSLGVALVAPQVLLTLELYSQTTRMEAVGASSFLPILSHLPRLVAPTITGTPLHGDHFVGLFNYTETDLYFGIAPLAFAVAALFSPWRRLAVGLVGLGLVVLLAVYGITPFRQLVTLVFPVFLNTFPGRILYVVAFTWAISAGLGADWLATARPVRVLRCLSIGAGILAVTVLSAFGLLLQNNPSFVGWLGRQLPQGGQITAAFLGAVGRKVGELHATSLLIAFAWLAAVTLLLWLWANSRLRPLAFVTLGTVLVAADVVLAGINYNPAFDSEWAFPETPSLAFLRQRLKKEPEPCRIVTVNSNEILTGMVPQLFGFQTVTGYSSWVLRRYSEYMELIGARASQNHMYFGECCRRLLDALNAKYVYASPGAIPTSSEERFSLLGALNKAHIDTQLAEGVQRSSWTIGGRTESVLFEHPWARISYSLDIKPGAKLWTAISVSPLAWDKNGDGVNFEAFVTPPGEPEVSVFSRYINPKRNVSERCWMPVEVDLTKFAGKEIVLTLVTSPGPSGDNSFDWAGWADPHIATHRPDGMELIYDGPNRVYENKAALPRAWAVHQVRRVRAGDVQAVKMRLLEADFDPAVEAVVEADGTARAESAQRVGVADPTDRVKITHYSSTRVTVETKQAGPGLLVLSDVMYPGWKANVDGVEQPILTANLIMRGVYVETGAHTVEFSYEAKRFSRGLWATAATLLLGLGATIGPRALPRLKRRFAVATSRPR